ncbi:MAG: SurA N-terminal domain-containing protein [Cellvibrionaceae bacterium]
MLQSMRDNIKGTAAFILVIIICIPFALFGVDALFTSNGAQNAAEINGDKISQQELQREIYLQKQQLLSRKYKGDLSDEALSGPVLDNLIRTRLMRQLAEDSNMAISGAAIDQILINEPSFQSDGKFDPNKYIRLIANIGHSPSSYKAALVQDLLINQLQTGFETTAFLTDKESFRIAALLGQKRDFGYMVIPKASVTDIQVTEDEIAANYEANKTDLKSTEQVSVTYIELKLADIATRTDASDEDIAERYEAFVKEFKSQVERRVAHILIELKDDGSHARALEQIQSKLDTGEDFAALAKEFSEDAGSNQEGGDLGYTTGDTFPEAFESAAAKLSVNEVSTAVETESGFHFIKLLEVKGEEAPSLTEMKEKLGNEIKREKAEIEFVEVQEKLREESYDSTDFEELASSLDLKAEESPFFNRDAGIGVAQYPIVRRAAFGEDILVEQQNSDLLEISNDHVIVIRLKEHQPERQLELAEVSNQIKAKLVAEKSGVALTQKAKDLVTQITDESSLAIIAEKEGLKFESHEKQERNGPGIPSEIRSSAFGISRIGTDIVPLTNGDVAVVELTKIHSDDVDTSVADGMRQWLSRQAGQRDVRILEESNKDVAAIEIFN